MPDENKMIVRYTQEQTAYTLASTRMGEVCAACRWYVGEQAGGPACHIVENYPLDIAPTGYCNEYAGVENALLDQVVNMESPMAMQEMAHSDASGLIGQTLIIDGKEVPVVFSEDMLPVPDGYIAPDSNNSNILKTLLERFKNGMKPGVNVLKDASGRRYMLIVTSNSYEDRDKETITTDALKADTERHWIADDIYKSDNPLLFWHEDKLRLGDIVFGDVREPFLIEIAREGDTPLAHKVFTYIENHPETKWGASHRFGYRDPDRTGNGTFKRIYKKETSVLPRQHAANLITYSGVLPMSKERNAFVDKMLGLEGAMDVLEKEGIQALVAKLNAAGVSHKSEDKPEVPVTNETDKTVAVFGKLVEAVIESQADLDARIEAVTKSLNDRAKAYDDSAKDLQNALKSTQDMQAALKQQLDARPRLATRASENEYINEELAAKVKGTQIKRDPIFGVAVKE